MPYALGMGQGTTDTNPVLNYKFHPSIISGLTFLKTFSEEKLDSDNKGTPFLP